MRIKGKLTSWNDDKAFGFITPNEGKQQVFIHINAFSNRSRRPQINQIVTFTMSADEQGRPCAANATRAGDAPKKKRLKKKGHFSIFVAFAFIAFLAATVFTKKLPIELFGFYCILSIITFILYAMDKSAAKSESQRTPETTLHLFALVGGWPGAIFAQQKLRHKSSKQEFRFIFWITVLINCGLFIWLLTPEGANVLHILLKNIYSSYLSSAINPSTAIS